MNQATMWEIDKFTRCLKCSSFLAYVVQENLSVKMFCLHCRYSEVRTENIRYLLKQWVEKGNKIPGQPEGTDRFRDWVHRNRYPND